MFYLCYYKFATNTHKINVLQHSYYIFRSNVYSIV
jgi:hypothetical protein